MKHVLNEATIVLRMLAMDEEPLWHLQMRVVLCAAHMAT